MQMMPLRHSPSAGGLLHNPPGQYPGMVGGGLLQHSGSGQPFSTQRREYCIVGNPKFTSAGATSPQHQTPKIVLPRKCPSLCRTMWTSKPCVPDYKGRRVSAQQMKSKKRFQILGSFRQIFNIPSIKL
ncbi:hypothetical protein WDU94_003491 [Cyamophila willieti]